MRTISRALPSTSPRGRAVLSAVRSFRSTVGWPRRPKARAVRQDLSEYGLQEPPQKKLTPHDAAPFLDLEPPGPADACLKMPIRSRQLVRSGPHLGPQPLRLSVTASRTADRLPQ